MIKPSSLFSLKSSQVAAAFDHATLCGKTNGLKLLTVPYDKISAVIPAHEYGMLLIITPRAVGKAHKRNKIRRQLKSIFYQEKLYHTAQLAIMLVYKPATELTFDQLKQFLVTNITQCTYKQNSQNPIHRKRREPA